MATKMNPTKRKALAKRKMAAAKRARENAANQDALDKEYKKFTSAKPKKKAKAKPKKKKVSREEQSKYDMETIQARQRVERNLGLKRGTK